MVNRREINSPVLERGGSARGILVYNERDGGEIKKMVRIVISVEFTGYVLISELLDGSNEARDMRGEHIPSRS